jgi:hypothetical protein
MQTIADIRPFCANCPSTLSPFDREAGVAGVKTIFITLLLFFIFYLDKKDKMTPATPASLSIHS